MIKALAILFLVCAPAAAQNARPFENSDPAIQEDFTWMEGQLRLANANILSLTTATVALSTPPFVTGASSRTYISADQTSTATSFSVCFATVTLTFNVARPAKITFTGGMARNQTNGDGATLNVIMDGAYFDGYSGTIGMAGSRESAGSNASFSYRTQNNVAAGSHSFCIQLSARNGSTADLFCTTYGMRCVLLVEEIGY